MRSKIGRGTTCRFYPQVLSVPFRDFNSGNKCRIIDLVSLLAEELVLHRLLLQFVLELLYSFSPVLSVITTEVTAPALIIVGALMAMDIRNIDWGKIEIVIPAFLTIIMMPLTSSVAFGLAFGFILYPLTLIAQKRFKEVHPIMYVLAILFILYFVFIA